MLPVDAKTKALLIKLIAAAKRVMATSARFERATSSSAGKRSNPLSYEASLVPKVGLEPTRAYAHYALNVARLPIPPLRPNC